MTEQDSDKGRPLTSEENAELRDLLEKEKRVIWFWATLRIFALWITSIVAAYYAAKSFLQDVINGAFK
jgi:hypothetical protein